ncbi:penicillin-binding protein 1A [Candidatus Pelagibacter communis]|uniref:penicillin-binding protein 1A n=1 Tax=Pelagibacter ubique TaxID=198252 RepID=UPI00094DA943|nr:PBP1A family penicillin-binding protein [Candidatus Pelagibacter ubique]
MNKLIKKTLLIFSTSILLFLIVLIAILWGFSNDLPDYKFLKNYKAPVSSKVYSGNGELIQDFSSEKRIFIPYNSIPPIVINSFLSAEDKNFFDHPGVDAKGVLRAVIKNVSNIINSRRLEGASTITQQVAKNFLLSNEVSLNRKLKEAILAFRIERSLNKERILELYLNQIYLGQGSYGIASASLEYFDKAVDELNYDEAALLAALPKAPSRYNPYKNKKLSEFRRNLVLKNLYENKYISFEEYEKLKIKKIVLKKRKKVFLEDSRYYVEEIRKNTIKKLGYDKVYKEGLNIKTPLNLELQKLATNSLREGIESYDRRKGWRGPIENVDIYNPNWMKKIKTKKLESTLNWTIAMIVDVDNLNLKIKTTENKLGFINHSDLKWIKKDLTSTFKPGDLVYTKKKQNGNEYLLKQLPKANGAIVVMDPFNGRVLALSGGFSFNQSEFNRATQALRQPGSAFKPFVYAMALENGYSPSTLVLDAPLVLEQGSDLKMWKPENYGKKFYGPSTLRMGLEKSRNLMTVRIAQDLGLKKITKFSKQLGIYENPNELLSISLGSAETTLLKLTSAYCSFVNGGKLVKPKMVDRIQDSEGNTIFKTEDRKCENCENISLLGNEIPIIKDESEQIFSPQTAYQITSILEGATQTGTAKKLKDLNMDIAGKTGTTNNNTDTWFIGFTSNLVIGVYVGFDEPKTLGKFETGSKTAMPIFKRFIKSAVRKENTRPFKVPEDITMMVVDSKTGKKVSFSSKKTLIESFKSKKDTNKFDISEKLNNRFNNNNILRFY